MSRTVIGTLPGSTACRRLLVCLEQRPADGQVSVALIEQDQAPGIGWYDQRSLRLEAQQWRQLRSMFGPVAAELAVVDEPPPATIPFPTLGLVAPAAEEELSQQVG